MPRLTALIGRTGSSSPLLLVGGVHQAPPEQSGALLLAPNDDWYLLWDKVVSLAVGICK